MGTSEASASERRKPDCSAIAGGTRTGGRRTRPRAAPRRHWAPLPGNKDLKSEGRGDKDKGTLKKKKGALKDLLG